MFAMLTDADVMALHDSLEISAPGLPGIADKGKVQGVIDRIAMLEHYGELPDLWHYAAAYLECFARGHVFADYNKRTALLTTVVFLELNGVILQDDTDALVELTVKAATGEYDRQKIAAEIFELFQSIHEINPI